MGLFKNPFKKGTVISSEEMRIEGEGRLREGRMMVTGEELDHKGAAFIKGRVVEIKSLKDNLPEEDKVISHVKFSSCNILGGIYRLGRRAKIKEIAVLEQMPEYKTYSYKELVDRYGEDIANKVYDKE